MHYLTCNAKSSLVYYTTPPPFFLNTFRLAKTRAAGRNAKRELAAPNGGGNGTTECGPPIEEQEDLYSPHKKDLLFLN